MSQVQFCKYCNEIIGESNAIGIFLDPEIVTKNSDKSGNCHHEKPSEFKTKKFFGFLLKTEIFYPETLTETVVYEYIGYKNKFLLKICFLFNKLHIISTAEGNVSYYGFFEKLTGDGLKYFD